MGRPGLPPGERSQSRSRSRTSFSLLRTAARLDARAESFFLATRG